MAIKKILIFRFSALGDIAMTVPVIKNLLNQNPDIEVHFFSNSFVAPLFYNISRLKFYGINLKNYKGILGIIRLKNEIKKSVEFDSIADLHNVLRTKLLRFFLAPKKYSILDKARKDKRELTREKNKNLHPLKTMFERYADVFRKLGYSVSLKVDEGLIKSSENLDQFSTHLPSEIFIGIAPFAKHSAKMYPLSKLLHAAEMLLKHDDFKLMFFASKAEYHLLEDFVTKHDNCYFAGDGKTFEQELKIISGLKVMLSMDSANMHLASLYGIPVVSVWGGTHPYLGFYGWGQHYEYAIQENLACRPSSVYGNKTCPVHGAAGCMQGIAPNDLYEKIITVLKNSNIAIA